MRQENTPNKQPKLRFSSEELTVLAILFGATIVVSTGIQMGNALFPALSRLVNVPISTVTLLVSVWAFTELLSPFFGPLSDRYGHTTFVLIGLGTFTLGNLLCIVAPNFLTLLTFQVLVGLGYGVFSFSSSAVIGDVFAYDLRARATGIVRVAVSMTALVGVPVAAAIADRATARGSFGRIAGIGLAVLVLALTRLPRQSRQVIYPQSAEAKANLSRTIREIAHQRSAIVGLLTLAIWALIPAGVFIYLAAWLEKAFALTETQIGLAFSIAGVGGIDGECVFCGLGRSAGQEAVRRAWSAGAINDGLAFAAPAEFDGGALLLRGTCR
jgi:DHA1 family inner membrane transport protein